MTMKISFQQFVKTLTVLYSQREANHIADRVFEKVTGLSRLDRITKTDHELLPAQQKELEEKLQQLLAHEPLQYVTGEAWFYHLPFIVNKQVLIPRPETEELVEWVLENLKTNPPLKNAGAAHPFTILDIGTGSGCIAITLKKNLPAVHIIALDQSEKALQVARQNAALHQAAITLLQADILNPECGDQLPPIDIMISNPPYITEKERDEMQPEVVQHEPALALFVPDDDPLLFYKAILKAALQKLNTNGKVYLEIHEERGQEITALFQQYGFKKVILRKDLNGRDRMVSGELDK